MSVEEKEHKCGYAKHHHRIQPDGLNPKWNKQQRATFMAKPLIPVTSGITLLPNGEPVTTGRWTDVKLPTAFLGEVTANCLSMGGDYYCLMSIVPGMAKGYPDVYVKIVDAKDNGLNMQDETKNYTLQQLADCRAVIINVKEAYQQYEIANRLRDQEKLTGSISPEDKALRHKAFNYLQNIDIHFNSCCFVQFLHELGRNNINSSHMMISVVDIDVDNAFFLGTCMVYGNGVSKWEAMGTIDISGHELGHSFPKQAYIGHAGALNESFADCCGTSFEHWMYKKYPELRGKFDFTLGEDNAVGFDGPLRNMENPPACGQPGAYQDSLWGNPNVPYDYGNVHKNSGPTNKSFYLYCTQLGVEPIEALKTWIKVYDRLGTYATLMNFRDAIKAETAGASASSGAAISSLLSTVGLSDAAQSDWTFKTPPRRALDKGPAKKRARTN